MKGLNLQTQFVYCNCAHLAKLYFQKLNVIVLMLAWLCVRHFWDTEITLTCCHSQNAPFSVKLTPHKQGSVAAINIPRGAMSRLCLSHVYYMGIWNAYSSENKCIISLSIIYYMHHYPKKPEVLQ